MMQNWTIEKKHLPLKFTWKISRNTSDFKDNFIIGFKSDGISGLGEVAPNIRYGETHDLIEEHFLKFKSVISNNEIKNIIELQNVLAPLKLCHSLKFGIESAFVETLAKAQNKSVHEFFDLAKPEEIHTSFSIPIMNREELKSFIEPYKNFKSLKVKVNKETALETLLELKKITNQKLRIDGNESWDNVTELLHFLDQIKDMPVEFLEQPMPARLKDEYKILKKSSPFLVIADESIEDHANFDELSEQFDGINIKLMKTGSYLTAINLLKEARRREMVTMIGCMVETSLGINCAYELSSLATFLDLDGFLLLKNDPYKILKCTDGLITKA